MKRSRGLAVLIATLCMLPKQARPLHGQQPSTCEPASGLAALMENVLDLETRVPVPGVVVVASWQGANAQAVRSVTDSMGRASICAPPERVITLHASFLNLKLPTQTTVLTLARPTTHTFGMDLPTSYVRGSVIDQATGAAVANVAVRLANTDFGTITDNEGHFFFERVPARDYSLRAQHISYASVAALLSVRAEDLDAVIRLTPSVIALEPIVVTAFSRRLETAGFYERQKRGIGIFLNRKDIESIRAQNASDLLQRVPGIRFLPQTGRRPDSRAPRSTTTGRDNCRYKFIMDGSRTLPDFELDFVAAGSIEGLEIYNGLSEVPAVFRGIATADSGPACGLIAVWSRNSR